MCMSCVSNADFALTSGILGAASLRVGVRRLLPEAPRWTRRVSDEEAATFLASLAPERGARVLDDAARDLAAR